MSYGCHGWDDPAFASAGGHSSGGLGDRIRNGLYQCGNAEWRLCIDENEMACGDGIKSPGGIHFNAL